MKKKNLLSLGALALSLGLVVSGCSTPGQKGETGETGPQGPQGEPGTPGADGKTYADVIVLNDSVEEGYHVTQDVFAVEVGSDESVTFTFTADEGQPFDVITVVINETTYGPIFASTAEDGTTTATLELTNEQVGNSAQLRRATFATAATYGADLIDAYYDSIVEKDPQIGHKHDAEDEEKVELSEDYEEAIELFAEGYSKAKTGLTTELGKLEDDATVQDKIACADKYLETAKKTLDDAYTAAVTAAKATAKEALDDLAAGVTSTNYKEEDKTAQLTAAKGAVDAATTIAEIVKLVNETEVENKLEKGTYNKLYEHKGTAFAAVEGALESVLASEEGLDSENEDEYEALVAGLEVWDVSVEKLPTAVANEYFAKISEATEFETYEADAEDGSYKKGQVVLAVEGKKAVEDSLQGLKDQLVENIKKSYLDEVDNSKVITSTESKNNIKGAIGSAVDSWLNKNKLTAKLTKYYSISSGADLGIINYGGTLVEAIESTLNSNHNYDAFQDERLDTAVSSAKAKLEAKAKEIKDSDKLYASAISATLINNTSSAYNGMYKINPYIGINDTENEIDYRVDNPFILLTGMKEEKNTAGTVIGYYVSAANVAGLGNYSVDKYIDGLFTDTGDIESSEGTFETPFKVNEWLVGKLVEVGNVYDTGRDQYSSDILSELEKPAPATNASPLNGVIKAEGEIQREDWEDLYGDTKDFTMDEAANSAKAFTIAGTLLEGTNGAHTAYEAKLEELAVSDEIYAEEFDVGTGTIKSELKAAYDALKEGVLKGEKTQDDVDDFVADIDSLYAKDITTFEARAKQRLADFASTVAEGEVNVSEGDAVYVRHDEALELYGSVAYPCTNVTEIDEWYKEARLYVKGEQNTIMEDILSSDLKDFAKGLLERLKKLDPIKITTDSTNASRVAWEALVDEIEVALEGDDPLTDVVVFQGYVDSTTKPNDRLFYRLLSTMTLPSGKTVSLDDNETPEVSTDDTYELTYESETKEDLYVIYNDVVAIYNRLVALEKSVDEALLDMIESAKEKILSFNDKAVSDEDRSEAVSTLKNDIVAEIQKIYGSSFTTQVLDQFVNISVDGEAGSYAYNVSLVEDKFNDLTLAHTNWIITIGATDIEGEEITFDLLEGELEDLVELVTSAVGAIDGVANETE